MHSLIHRHLHKRNDQRLSQSSRSDFLLAFLDKATIAAGVIGPLMVLPQIFKIYSTHNAGGVSALSWFAFGLLDVPFIIYGLVHRDRPIIITYILWFVANFVVAIGAIVYA